MNQSPQDPPWRVIARSLTDYDREGLSEALRVTLDARLPSSGRLGTGRRQAFQAVEQDIERHTGVWSVAGPQVGHENLSAWCVCHSFCHAPEGAKRPQILERSVGDILAELDHVHGYLSALRDLFDSVAPLSREPGERALQLQRAYRRTTELTVSWGGCHDAWYNTLEDALGWCADALGTQTPHTLDLISQKVAVTCTSWVEPEPKDIEWLADELVLASDPDE